MKTILGITGILTLLASLGSCVMSKTVVHEIGSMILLLVGVVALGLASVIEELQSIGKRLPEKAETMPTLTDAKQ